MRSELTTTDEEARDRPSANISPSPIAVAYGTTAVAPEASTSSATPTPAAKVDGHGPSTVSSARPAAAATTAAVRCSFCHEPSGPPT
jgi:hypothetical protein